MTNTRLWLPTFCSLGERPPSQPKGIQYDNRLLVQLKTFAIWGAENFGWCASLLSKMLSWHWQDRFFHFWTLLLHHRHPKLPKPTCSSRWCPACHPTCCFRFRPFWVGTFKAKWSERGDTHHHLQSGQRKLHFKTMTPLPAVTEISIKRNLVEMIAVSNRGCVYSSSVTTNTMWEKCCTPCQKTVTGPQ